MAPLVHDPALVVEQIGVATAHRAEQRVAGERPLRVAVHEPERAVPDPGHEHLRAETVAHRFRACRTLSNRAVRRVPRWDQRRWPSGEDGPSARRVRVGRLRRRLDLHRERQRDLHVDAARRRRWSATSRHACSTRSATPSRRSCDARRTSPRSRPVEPWGAVPAGHTLTVWFLRDAPDATSTTRIVDAVERPGPVRGVRDVSSTNRSAAGPWTRR